jgi:hypothetical protein
LTIDSRRLVSAVRRRIVKQLPWEGITLTIREEENDVKTSKTTNQMISRHDYGPALRGALSWLGNRYLLAEPLNRRPDDRNQAVTDTNRLLKPEQGLPTY